MPHSLKAAIGAPRREFRGRALEEPPACSSAARWSQRYDSSMTLQAAPRVRSRLARINPKPTSRQAATAAKPRRDAVHGNSLDLVVPV
jgi:hypothetical protein